MRSLTTVALLLPVITGLLGCDPSTTPGPTAVDPQICDAFAPVDPSDVDVNDWNDPNVGDCEAQGCSAFIGSSVWWDEDLSPDWFGQAGYCMSLTWTALRDCAAQSQPGFVVVDDPDYGPLAFGTPPDRPLECFVVLGEVIPSDWIPCGDPAVADTNECTP